MAPNDCAAYLVAWLNPLHRAVAAAAVPAPSAAVAELAALAQQLLDLLRERVGDERFVQAYSHVSSSVARVRQQRKRARALVAVVDPSLAAQRRVVKNLRKRSQRKKRVKVGARAWLHCSRVNARVHAGVQGGEAGRWAGSGGAAVVAAAAGVVSTVATWSLALSQQSTRRLASASAARRCSAVYTFSSRACAVAPDCVERWRSQARCGCSRLLRA